MLVISFSYRSCVRIAHSCILLSCCAAMPLHSSQYWESETKPFQHFEQDWITRYFDSIDDDTEVGEVIDFLVAIRETLISRGYECPSLVELAIRLKEYLMAQGIEIDEGAIQELYEEIYRREQFINPASFKFASSNFFNTSFELCKHKRKDKHKDKKDEKEFKMKSKGVFGFLKCLAGGLMCIVPFAPIQAAGGALVLNGINDIIDDAREVGDENERLQKLDEQRRRDAQMFGEPQ